MQHYSLLGTLIGLIDTEYRHLKVILTVTSDGAYLEFCGDKAIREIWHIQRGIVETRTSRLDEGDSEFMVKLRGMLNAVVC